MLVNCEANMKNFSKNLHRSVAGGGREARGENDSANLKYFLNFWQFCIAKSHCLLESDKAIAVRYIGYI